MYSFVIRQPSWALRAALIVAVLVLMAVLLVLIIPAMVIGACAFLTFVAAARVRAMFRRTREPNGALDGRRNVRVVVHDQQS